MALAVVAASAVWLTGCAGQPPSLDATPTPWPRSDLWQQAGDAELFLAGVYNQADSMGLPGCGTWCAAASAMHQAHATVLTQPDPWGGFTEPTAEVLPEYGDLTALQQDLTSAANDALMADQAGLAAAAPGPEALLWASLVATADVSVTFANDQTRPMPTLTQGTAVPSQIDVGSTADAAGAALDAANAVVYVATVGAAQASTSDGLKASLGGTISGAKANRDALQAQIIALGDTPAAPALSYPLAAGVSSDGAVLASLGPFQDSLANAYVRMAGTMTGQDAVLAAEKNPAFTNTMTWWPGWG